MSDWDNTDWRRDVISEKCEIDFGSAAPKCAKNYLLSEINFMTCNLCPNRRESKHPAFDFNTFEPLNKAAEDLVTECKKESKEFLERRRAEKIIRFGEMYGMGAQRRNNLKFKVQDTLEECTNKQFDVNAVWDKLNKAFVAKYGNTSIKTWNAKDRDSSNTGDIFVELKVGDKTYPPMRFVYKNPNKENEKLYSEILEEIFFTTNYSFIITTPSYVKTTDDLAILRWEIEGWTDCEMFKWWEKLNEN